MINNDQERTALHRVWVSSIMSGHQRSVRIDVQSVDDSRRLLGAFRRLTWSRDRNIRLDQIVPVIYTDIESVELGVSEGTKIFGRSIFTLGKRVLWMPTRRGWRENARLLIGQMRSGSGHQYYGDDYGDDAVIEISLCEDRTEMMIQQIIAPTNLESHDV